MNIIAKPDRVLTLENGERMTQAEFYRRYEACPDQVKAELIGGVVYMASPLRRPHAIQHPELSGALWLYKAATPGIEILDNATTILGLKTEPQPDLALRILADFGGRSGQTVDEYVQGPPELLAEIAHSSAIDMHQKRNDYVNAGIIEFMVLCIEEQELHWFDFATNSIILPNRQGIYRSRVFPGLWIDGPALLARDSSRIMEVVQEGLAHREHAAFVNRLQAAYRKKSSS
jgi:Uma2 family endonuclease